MLKLYYCLLIVLMSTGISACGQKGPLFLPTKPVIKQPTTAPTTNTKDPSKTQKDSTDTPESYQ